MNLEKHLFNIFQDLLPKNYAPKEECDRCNELFEDVHEYKIILVDEDRGRGSRGFACLNCIEKGEENNDLARVL